MDLAMSLLEARGLSKSYGNVRALEDVDLELEAGEIHALMGENGAGKSTLIKLLSGAELRDGGIMRMVGAEVNPRDPLDAQALGISTVYQEINLVPTLSVEENLFLGRYPQRLGRIDWKEVNRRAAKALAKLDLQIDPRTLVAELPIALQQLVAIARALDIRAKVLILDEPTSSLDAAEVARMFELLRQLRREGLGILFVTHFLDQVYTISDRVTVLRNGRLVGTHKTSELPRLSLVAAMLGRNESDVSQELTGRPTNALGEQSLVAKGLGLRGTVEPFDLALHRGEVVGLAGLLGSGRTEQARLLFSLDHPDRGVVELQDGTRPKTPRQSLRAGVGLVPEDRKKEGLALNLSVRENIVLALQAKRGWLRRLPRREQEAIVERYIQALNIRTPSPETPVGRLSGGNQQKVVLARWLAVQPNVLILDEPTRGVDVGAKQEIERLIAGLRDEGLAILLIATEIEDVARQSHRVIVLRDGRQIGELVGEEAQPSRIMQLISGDTA